MFREGYSWKQFSADLIAGVIVGIVALPLAIALAIASGVKPEQGLYTAVVAGFVIAVLGGSRAQVSGPTGAFIVVVYAIVQQYGYEGLATATFMAGFMLMFMGFMGMGMLLRFIPYPVTVGFTSGIALIIFSSQIRDLLGLRMESVPAEFLSKWQAYGEAFDTINPSAVILGLVSMAVIFLWPKVTRKVPGSLVAIMLGTVIVQWFNIPVETIASRFGSVPNYLPKPHLIHINLTLIQEMFAPAMTIAFLGALESLLSAVVADGMLGTRHRSNMELVAQGVGNIVSPMFGGIPATGAIARTATNIKSGGRTPISSIIHSLTLLLIMICFGKWAALIPMPVLAAILINVAYNMSEWHTFARILRCPKSDVAVLLATFSLTVLIDLAVAIEVGVVLAAFLFLKRMEDVSEAGIVTSELSEIEEDEHDDSPIGSREVPKGVEVFEIYGPLFFGAVERFKNALKRVRQQPKILIIRMRHVPMIDATGLNALEDLLAKTLKDNSLLILSGLKGQALTALKQSGFIEKIGQANLVPNIDAALARARALIG